MILAQGAPIPAYIVTVECRKGVEHAKCQLGKGYATQPLLVSKVHGHYEVRPLKCTTAYSSLIVFYGYRSAAFNGNGVVIDVTRDAQNHACGGVVNGIEVK